MKTKLLKKIRKQYSIVYYPNGAVRFGIIMYVGQYVLSGNDMFEKAFYKEQQAKDKLLEIVRKEYKHYSRLVNIGTYDGTKVWHNNK